MKCRDILQIGKSRLKEYGVPSFDSDAEFLLAEAMGVSRGEIAIDVSVSEDVVRNYYSLISRRASHEPMDSIFGFTEFMGIRIPFSVDTLTPRQETEIMTDDIVRSFRNRKDLKVLDLCAGSGCIGLAIKKNMNCLVTLSDISDKALEECRRNAELNNLCVDIVKSNLFDGVEDTFDIIISNPPYIPTNDIALLEREVIDYDPHISLDGGEDGLDFYRKIVEESPSYLNENGVIYLEFGINQSNEIFSLMSKDFEDIEIVKDYSGLDRYIKGKKKQC